MLGGDGQDLANSQAAEVVDLRLQLGRVDLVDGKEDGLAAAQQQPRQLDVGAGDLGAPVDHHHHRVGLFQGDARLAKDLGGDQFLVLGDDAAGVDHGETAAVPLRVAVKTVAGDAGLVADNRPPPPDDAIEERGLADVRAANDGERGRSCRGAGFCASSQEMVYLGDLVMVTHYEIRAKAKLSSLAQSPNHEVT